MNPIKHVVELGKKVFQINGNVEKNTENIKKLNNQLISLGRVLRELQIQLREERQKNISQKENHQAEMKHLREQYQAQMKHLQEKHELQIKNMAGDLDNRFKDMRILLLEGQQRNLNVSRAAFDGHYPTSPALNPSNGDKS